MSVTEFHNFIGQRIDVGDVVGWGRRQGNQSAHQVGIVLALTENKRGAVEAKCLWVHGGMRPNYSSSTEANVLFVLDPHSLGQEEYEDILTAAHSYAIESERKEAARNANGAA